MKRALVVAGLLAVVLTGCGPYAPPYLPAVPPAKDDLVGTWLHEDDDSSTGATLTLRADGTLTYTGIPAKVVSDSDTYPTTWSTSTDLRSGTGTWSYDTNQTFIDRLSVMIDLDVLANQRLDYDANPFGTAPKLNFVVGDPDLGDFYGLTRQD